MGKGQIQKKKLKCRKITKIEKVKNRNLSKIEKIKENN